MIVDWTTVGTPPLRLTLEQEAHNYIVLDADDGDTVYMRASLGMCVRFMRAMAVKKQAVLDEDSISWFRALAGHSVRVPALEEGGGPPGHGTTAPPPSSNVVPIAPKFCKACGDKVINRGAHAERCYGRPAKATT